MVTGLMAMIGFIFLHGTVPHQGSAASKLYFNDLSPFPGSETFAGDLLGHVAGATIFDGYYWYIDDSTDDLKRVSLDSNGLVVSETKIADIAGNTKAFNFGDFVFNGTGLLIGSGQDNTGDLFFTYDVVNNIFSSISRNAVLQLALGIDGVLYGQDASNGRVYSIDPSTDTRTFLFTIPDSIRLTDLAALDPAIPVPESATLALMGLGLAGIGYRRHRSKKAA